MVLPSDPMLTVRNCKQFAAIGLSDGKGEDITTVAKWSSSDESVAIDHFGASAPGGEVLERFGFTAENVAAKARESIAAAQR